MVCVHPPPPSTRRRLGQFLPEADGQDHDGSRDQPRHYQPVRNRPRSPALNAAQRVLPIPFGLIEETKRDVVGHRATRQQVKSPAGIILSHCYRLTHQRSIKQTIIFERVGSIYLWQILSWAMQELPHGLPFVQYGPLVFGGSAQTRAHKTLPGIAGHALRERLSGAAASIAIVRSIAEFSKALELANGSKRAHMVG